MGNPTFLGARKGHEEREGISIGSPGAGESAASGGQAGATWRCAERPAARGEPNVSEIGGAMVRHPLSATDFGKQGDTRLGVSGSKPPPELAGKQHVPTLKGSRNARVPGTCAKRDLVLAGLGSRGPAALLRRLQVTEHSKKSCPRRGRVGLDDMDTDCLGRLDGKHSAQRRARPRRRESGCASSGRKLNQTPPPPRTQGTLVTSVRYDPIF